MTKRLQYLVMTMILLMAPQCKTIVIAIADAKLKAEYSNNGVESGVFNLGQRI